MAAKDLTGQRFGRLVVTGRGEDYINSNGHHVPRWKCICDCGGTALVQGAQLKNGRSKSCGCLQREIAKKRAEEMDRSIEISGQKFGRLTAVKRLEKSDKAGFIWECLCDCGNVINVSVKMLRSGNTKSCGCLRDEKISLVNKKHGESKKSRLYGVWVGIRQRCNDPSHKSYKNYGGRGIRVCDEWNDFMTFKDWAIRNGYDESAEYGDCTIDRIDVNGNYEPSNCRWVDMKIQACNKRK